MSSMPKWGFLFVTIAFTMALIAGAAASETLDDAAATYEDGDDAEDEDGVEPSVVADAGVDGGVVAAFVYVVAGQGGGAGVALEEMERGGHVGEG